MWDTIRYGGTSSQVSPFARDPWEEAHRRMLARHKLWLESLQHEYPSPYAHYRIGVYIRFFNQTRYDNYLLFHKQEFIDTIALCPNWTLVDFYVDEGQTAPYMENAKVIRESLMAQGFTVFGGVDAPYIWLKVPQGMTSWAFFDLLLDKCHIVGTPGSGFGPSGEGYFRLTAFNTLEKTKQAMERVSKLKEA